MIDSAAISLWITDLVLLGLAYWIGRMHGSNILRGFYLKKLSEMLDEIKTLRRKVDKLNDLYLTGIRSASGDISQ